MSRTDPPWYFLPVTTILGILITGVVYIIGANLLNWVSPGTVTRFLSSFFKLFLIFFPEIRDKRSVG